MNIIICHEIDVFETENYETDKSLSQILTVHFGILIKYSLNEYRQIKHRIFFLQNNQMNRKQRTTTSYYIEVFFVSRLGFEDEANFTISQRGSLKLIHNGYKYLKDSESNGITSWRCEKQRRQYCKGKAQTQKIGETQMVRTRFEHNHLPEHIRTEN